MKILLILGLVSVALATNGGEGVSASMSTGISQGVESYEMFNRANFNGKAKLHDIKLTLQRTSLLAFHSTAASKAFCFCRNLQPLWMQDLLSSDRPQLPPQVCWICHRALLWMERQCSYHCGLGLH